MMFFLAFLLGLGLNGWTTSPIRSVGNVHTRMVGVRAPEPTPTPLRHRHIMREF